jgi:hypothetical protein
LPDVENELERFYIHGAHFLASRTADTGPGGIFFEEFLLQPIEHFTGYIADKQRWIAIGCRTSIQTRAAVKTMLQITGVVDVLP